MKEILSKNQTAILNKIRANDFLTGNFYLTGGTALAAFYLGHRYSEDLDFFSEKEFDILNLDIFFKQIKKELEIKKVDFQQSYNRNLFFLHFDSEVVKTEFTFFPFSPLEKPLKEMGLNIDSILDIATNKLFAIYQRTKARDYIDLYLICREKNYTLDDLKKKARLKFDWHIDPIQLGSQFGKVEEAEDYPNMITPIENSEWQNFFVEEVKKLKSEILDK